MRDYDDVEKQFYKVLEEKGGKAADEAREALLDGVKSNDLRAPLKYLSENWRDTLRPALIVLSCEAIGGQPEKTLTAAKAMALLGLSLTIYDDIMDKTKFKRFIPTLPGKFGEGLALIAGGLVTAKAFSLLSTLGEDGVISIERLRINAFVNDFLMKTAEAEALNLRLRKKDIVSVREKLHVLRMQAAHAEACMKIGAVLGGRFHNEVEHLGNYGLHFGTVLELHEDLKEALNLTLELADKIKRGAKPYLLIWAESRSEGLHSLLTSLSERNRIEPEDIKDIVKGMLDAEVTRHLNKLIRKQIRKANNELLKIKNKEAGHLLKFLAEAQHQQILKTLYAF